MAALLTAVLLAIVGALCVALVVQAVRQNRDDAGLDEQRASLADERARGTEAGGSAAPDSDLSDAETRVTDLAAYAEYSGPLFYEQEVRR